MDIVMAAYMRNMPNPNEPPPAAEPPAPTTPVRRLPGRPRLACEECRRLHQKCLH
jgi:hypothetical protein